MDKVLLLVLYTVVELETLLLDNNEEDAFNVAFVVFVLVNGGCKQSVYTNTPSLNSS